MKDIKECTRVEHEGFVFFYKLRGSIRPNSSFPGETKFCNEVPQFEFSLCRLIFPVFSLQSQMGRD